MSVKRDVNNILVRVCDKFPVNPKEFLDVGFDDEIFISLKGNLEERRIKDNQDGTVDLVLNFKAIEFSISKEDKQ